MNPRARSPTLVPRSPWLPDPQQAATGHSSHCIRAVRGRHIEAGRLVRLSGASGIRGLGEAGVRMGLGLAVVVGEPYPRVLDRVRGALADQTFTILSETNLSQLLLDRLGVETPPQTVLGVCSPPLARAVLDAEPSLGLLVPSMVVVRAQTDEVTVVEAADPRLLVAATGDPDLEPVAADVTARIAAAFGSLTRPTTAGNTRRAKGWPRRNWI